LTSPNAKLLPNSVTDTFTVLCISTILSNDEAEKTAKLKADATIFATKYHKYVK